MSVKKKVIEFFEIKSVPSSPLGFVATQKKEMLSLGAR